MFNRSQTLPFIDLSHLPVVDNHCHGLYRDPTPLDAANWRRSFTESFDPETQSVHVVSTLYYGRMVTRLARFLGCAATEEEIISARARWTTREWVGTLLRDAGISGLVIDKGLPAPDKVLSDQELGELGSCRVVALLRLELLMQELIATYPTLEAVSEALDDRLRDIRGSGYAGLKSIVAYRTGLEVNKWSIAEARQSFAEARRVVAEQGTVRLAHKPVLDTLLHVAFRQAARQAIPIQFHTGYGDTDADLLLANPLHLRAVLETPEYRSMPVVLLHESYPYTREGGYLATVYDHVYLDVSCGIPFLSHREMVACARAALGVAPYSKILYSSDGVGLPEIHWASAHDGRRVWGQVLGEAVDDGDLTIEAAHRAGAAILSQNAERVYGL